MSCSDANESGDESEDLPWANRTQKSGAAAQPAHDPVAVNEMLSALNSGHKSIPCPAANCDLEKGIKLPVFKKDTPTLEVLKGLRAMNMINHAIEVLEADPQDQQHQLLVRFDVLLRKLSPTCAVVFDVCCAGDSLRKGMDLLQRAQE